MFEKEIADRLKGQSLSKLMAEADGVRRKFCGAAVHLRGIIEFSNYCCRNCLYCGLRRDNKKIKRYRMAPEEVVDLAGEIIGRGIRTIVLQSGDDFGYSREMISGMIEGIKAKDPGVAVTLCVGERPLADYREWKEAGADRYLLRHETANPGLYAKLHPGRNLDQRVGVLGALRELDYQVGAGFIVGLPGQTIEDLAKDIALLRYLGVDMAGIGPFIPQKNTPLAGCPPGDLGLTLKALAMARIVTQNAHLPATTALASLDPEEGLRLGLEAGANVIMPEFTPEKYRNSYAIYDNKVRINIESAGEIILKSGRIDSKDRGDSLKCKKRPKVFACT